MTVKSKSLRFFIFILIVFGFSLIQNFNFLKIGDKIKPSLVLILIIYYALKLDDEYAYILGFLGGLFMDINSVGTFGLNCFSHTLMAYIVTLFKSKIYSENILSIFIFVFIFSIIHNIIIFILLTIFTGHLIMLDQVISESLYNSVLTPILFFLLEKLVNAIMGKR